MSNNEILFSWFTTINDWLMDKLETNIKPKAYLSHRISQSHDFTLHYLKKKNTQKMEKMNAMWHNRRNINKKKALIASSDYHTPIYRIKLNLVKWMQMWDLGHLMCHKSNLSTATNPVVMHNANFILWIFDFYVCFAYFFLCHPLR